MFIERAAVSRKLSKPGNKTAGIWLPPIVRSRERNELNEARNELNEDRCALTDNHVSSSDNVALIDNSGYPSWNER
ncbi:hypothetical protein ACFO4N_15440 [Camelliibacillus cellulosilyticus]|uniref:Uncharacterized protein n=1 Tax=Camelliibacillus cellulosilyticus TaxID=2174486 RepID=A0ABV9GS80_9BACL